MPQIDPRSIEYVPLDDLRPDPRNPRAHADDLIDASIGRFGVLDLIVRDERTGFIVSGHGRKNALAAMQERGETPPDGVLLGEGGVWLVPVVVGWASRSDTEAAAALIALNRTNELGGWVDEALLDLLEDLSEAGAEGLVGVGYSEDDMTSIRTTLSDLQDADIGLLEPPVEAFTQASVKAPVMHTCPSCGHIFE